MKRPSSVIIIGAGAAGWSAAQKLVDSGINVLMLEARSRIGGRILTQHNAEYPSDLGAEFVHEGAKEIYEILSAKDSILRVSEKHSGFWKNRRIELSGFWKKVLPLLKKIKVHTPDRPIADFVQEVSGQLNDFERAMLVDYIEGFNATDVYDLSESALALEKGVSGIDGNSRIIKGYDALFDPFRRLQESSQFELLLNCHVRRVEWKMGEVKIISEMEGHARTDYAQAAVVTVPTPILANQDIYFYPAIEEKIEAANGIALGPVFKVVMTFNEMPWAATEDVEFVHSPELTFGARWLWGLYNSKSLVSWSGGHRAEKLIGRTREEITARALADLESSCNIPKDRLQQIVASIDFHDWQSDCLSRGAYSYVKVGAVGVREKLAESILNTLFFAGEATMADGSSGTVHGALRSGFRAADEILQLPD